MADYTDPPHSIVKRISWKVMLAVALIFASIAIISAVGLIMYQLRQNNAYTNCRARYNARVIDAQSGLSIEQTNLFVVAIRRGDVPTQLDATDTEKRALISAKDALVAYTDHQTLPCPI